jgi:hypothetical protein
MREAGPHGVLKEEHITGLEIGKGDSRCESHGSAEVIRHIDTERLIHIGDKADTAESGARAISHRGIRISEEPHRKLHDSAPRYSGR